MIVNVINGQSTGISESAEPNVFAGMSLAEACGQLQANVSDILNEMNMGILLNEHMYLRENGEDIQYVNEADTKLKDRIGGAIDNIIKQVSQLWDSLVKWVQERVENVRMAFARAGIDKKKAEAAKSGSIPKCDIKVVTTKSVNRALSFINKDKINDAQDADFDTKTYIEKWPSVTSAGIDEAFNNVYKTDGLLGDIRAAKKSAISALSGMKAEAKKKGSDDDKAQQIKDINEKSRKISKMTSVAIKLYHMRVDSSVQILKAAINPEKAAKAVDRAANVEETKDKIKSKMPKFGKKSEKEATSESAIFNDDRFFKV